MALKGGSHEVVWLCFLSFSGRLPPLMRSLIRLCDRTLN